MYTQFGYAQVDLDKYKDDSNITQALSSNISISNNSSPEKKGAAYEEQNANNGGDAGGG